MDKIGLGCVTFGREIGKETAFSLMDYAVEKGILFWDTAAAYGNGASEKIIGEWLNKNPLKENPVTISTKIMPPFNADTLEGILAQSLHRLKITSIDVVYLHNWHGSAASKNVLIKITELIKKELAYKFGLSNFNSSQVKQVLELCEQFGLEKPAYIQNNNNFAVSDISTETIHLCQNHDINIVTYSPLGAGFLTGKHTGGVVEGSRFDMMPAHQQIYFTEQSIARLNTLQKLSEESGIPLSKLALAWAFNQPFVSKVLIGAREKRHVEQALEAVTYSQKLVSSVKLMNGLINNEAE